MVTLDCPRDSLTTDLQHFFVTLKLSECREDTIRKVLFRCLINARVFQSAFGNVPMVMLAVSSFFSLSSGIWSWQRHWMKLLLSSLFLYAVIPRGVQGNETTKKYIRVSKGKMKSKHDQTQPKVVKNPMLDLQYSGGLPAATWRMIYEKISLWFHSDFILFEMD